MMMSTRRYTDTGRRNKDQKQEKETTMSTRGQYTCAGLLVGIAMTYLALVGPSTGAGTPVAAAAPAATPTPRPTPAPTATTAPVALMPAAPGLARNSVARFTFSRHFYHPGEMIQGRITLLDRLCASASACYQGTDWTRAGAPPKACAIRALTCRWVATQPHAPGWFVAHMPISSTVAQTGSDDYYTVVDKSLTVLDGTVTDLTGAPLTPVTLTISGPRTVRLPVDPLGYFSAVLPRGQYTVRLDAGSAAANHWFQTGTRVVTLKTFATVDFTGYDHAVATVSRPWAVPTGVDAVTVTIRALNPFGLPLPNHMVTVNTGGVPALLCAIAPRVGRVEPANVVRGHPLFTPLYQLSDAAGWLTYRAYVGTQAGSWSMTVNDGDVARLAPTVTLARAQAHVSVARGAWLSYFPQRFLTTLYSKKGTAQHRPLSLTQALWAAVQGKTTRTPMLYGANGGFTVPQYGSDVAANQRAMLRWVATYMPLHRLDIAPLTGGVAARYGVVIYAHDHLDRGSDTRVLDAQTLMGIINGKDASAVPATLPTLPQWQALYGKAHLGFGGFAPENGITYNGYPHLPADDNALTTFENSCVALAG